ncbi:MAG: hypothetical protein RMA76_13820 [Deltaproteobacteria bacterium]|jgi:hypothetical protein
MIPPSHPRSGLLDPVLGLAAIAAVAAHAWMLFVGRYLPFIDWSNHLGLIAILAHGGDALTFAERSFAPTPYWLFYMTTAAFAQVVSVEAAAKLTFLAATAATTLATADLARTCGRDPRIAAIAPLAMFSVALGYGFAAWVCGVWTVPLVLAAVERALDAPTRTRTALLAAAWTTCFLAHALLFLFVSVALTLRVVVDLLGRGRSEAAGRLRAVAVAAAPAFLVGLVTVARLEPGSSPTQWAHFEPTAWSLARLGSDLLQRGDDRHVYTMLAALAWWIGLLFLGARQRRHARRGTVALALYAGLAGGLYAFGPMTLEHPVEVWMLAPRFGAIAALFLFLLPTASLRSRAGLIWVGAALALLFANAALNRQMIAKFDRIGQRYDPVRRHIPRGATYLALTLVPPGDLATYHPAVQSLFFHHLCDGAAYTAYLFDNPLHPVRPKQPRPPAPPWRDVASYAPDVHGVAYDFLVLRGALLVERTKDAGRHRLVAEENGWFVFETVR